LNSEESAVRPLATFVLYAYNEERYIREAIESAFAQTYSPMEVVLSDDGSTDRTFEIMQEMAADYRGPHQILLNRNEKNIGIGSQLNSAVAMTRGTLILLANGDDVSLPHRVTRTMEVWENSGRSATAITVNLICMDEKGEPLGRTIDSHPSFQGLEDGIRKRFGPVSAASLSISRTAFKKFGELMPQLIIEDGPIYMRAVLLGPRLHIDESLVRYRVHEGNISQAYAVDRYATWLKRHHERAIWQSREGTKAYLQMLSDLYSQACDSMNPEEIYQGRWAAMEKLMEYSAMSAYFTEDTSVPLIARLRSLYRLAWLVCKLQVKRALPFLRSRNDHWHYRRVVEASSEKRR
jgi:glycosyltransferase involved in cell wall biosynthesis